MNIERANMEWTVTTLFLFFVIVVQQIIIMNSTYHGPHG